MIKATILGSGSSSGVPAVSLGWGACDPNNPKNRRTRPSILVERDDTRLLVDTSPDLRQQLLAAEVRALSGVIYTHDHADHLHGLDDLREINRAMDRPLAIWGAPETLTGIIARFGYAFEGLAPQAKGNYYKPVLLPNEVRGNDRFTVGALDVEPFDQDHGFGYRTLGLRFGSFAYSTDVVHLSEAAFEVLAGVDTWVVGCLANQPHPTHAHVDMALGWIDRVKPRRAVVAHMGPRLDYATLRGALPPGVEPAYDGMVLECP